jgi:asparagine synthase (glutamine-hydrolysing)
MPDEFRMDGITGKRILRDAVRDLLPPEILRRPKKGFGIPVAAWFKGPLRQLLHDVLSPRTLAGTGLYKPQIVQRMIDEHTRGQRDHRKPLWTLFVFELWRQHHQPALSTAPTSAKVA